MLGVDKKLMEGAMKGIVFVLTLLWCYSVCAVTAEDLYGYGLAYHSHTVYALRVAGLR